MKRRDALRELRLAHVGVGALILAVPASAAALTGGPRTTSSSSQQGAPGPAPETTPTLDQHITPRRSPIRVRLRADIRVPSRAIDVLGGGSIHVRGRLLPAAAHRRVQLEALRRWGWRTVATARTGPRGGFDLRYGAGGLGRQPLRVRFTGDRASRGAVERAGSVTIYRPSVASWYADAGSTACGFHAHYGVASPSLPCGSTVRFRSGGRTVTAVVDDRGPYVGGRAWDLNQNTAAALAMGGVATVWSSS